MILRTRTKSALPEQMKPPAVRARPVAATSAQTHFDFPELEPELDPLAHVDDKLDLCVMLMAGLVDAPTQGKKPMAQAAPPVKRARQTSIGGFMKQQKGVALAVKTSAIPKRVPKPQPHFGPPVRVPSASQTGFFDLTCKGQERADDRAWIEAQTATWPLRPAAWDRDEPARRYYIDAARDGPEPLARRRPGLATIVV